MAEVKERVGKTPIGIPHDDGGCGGQYAGSRQKGANHVQGTINGYGERVANANLCTIIPDLQLKMGFLVCRMKI